MQNYKITEQELVILLKYLLTKPMMEVEPLVNMIRKLEKIEKE